jgi:hypothetical protein
MSTNALQLNRNRPVSLQISDLLHIDFNGYGVCEHDAEG